jgi:hypothetical protein
VENLIQLQAQLQKVPDQSLQGYLHQPSQAVPPFMVLMEMQRRAKTRQQAQAPQQPAPQTTVAQDLEAQDGGLGSLNMQAPQGFKEGGIVGYADGGSVDDEDVAPIVKIGRYLEGLMPQPRYGDIRQQPGIDDMIGNSQRSMLGFINGLGRPTTATPGFNPNASSPGFVPPAALGGMSMPPDTPAPIADAAQAVAGGGMDRLSLLKQEWQKYMMAGDTKSADVVQREIDRLESGQTGDTHSTSDELGARVAAAGAAPAVGGLASVLTRGTPAAAAGPAGGLQPMAVPDAPVRPNAPSNYSMDDVLAAQQRIAANLPDIYGRANDIAEARAARAADRRQNAGKDSALEMGLSMMASKNPSFTGSIGEGGLAALKAQRDSERLADKDMDTADDVRIKVLQAQRAAAQGDMQTAAAIMNTIHDNESRDYQTQASMYGADQQNRASIFGHNVQLQAANSRAEIAQLVAEGRMSQMEANMALAGLRMQNEAMKGELGQRKQDETERRNVQQYFDTEVNNYVQRAQQGMGGVQNMNKTPDQLRNEAEAYVLSRMSPEDRNKINRQQGNAPSGTLKIGPNGQWVK